LNIVLFERFLTLYRRNNRAMDLSLIKQRNLIVPRITVFELIQ
jgi:hypothetical protein